MRKKDAINLATTLTEEGLRSMKICIATSQGTAVLMNVKGTDRNDVLKVFYNQHDLPKVKAYLVSAISDEYVNKWKHHQITQAKVESMKRKWKAITDKIIDDQINFLSQNIPQ